MKIGLFALETGRDVGGLEVYERNLIQALAKVDEVNEYVVFSLDARVPELLEVKARNFEHVVLPVNRYRGVLWDAPRAMASAGLDLFHAMFVPPPITSVPYVFTHHGTEITERPDFYPFALGLRMRLLVRRAFRKAGLILCVSDFVRESLANEGGIARERLKTVYCGVRSEFRPIAKELARERVGERWRLNRPYILVVGRIEPRKNPIRLLRAYHRFRSSNPHPPLLVFAGKKTWSGKEFDRTTKELQLENDVVELGHVPHEDLPHLYAGAEFSVFASLWEGFGLAAVEAFAMGTPLISSNATSLPEVCQGASLEIDPNSVDELAVAMHRLHSNHELKEELRCKGQMRASTFAWEETARQTIEGYQMLHRRVKRSNNHRALD